MRDDGYGPASLAVMASQARPFRLDRSAGISCPENLRACLLAFLSRRGELSFALQAPPGASLRTQGVHAHGEELFGHGFLELRPDDLEAGLLEDLAELFV